MNGDIRHPQTGRPDEDQNKQLVTNEEKPTVSLEAPHLYSQEEGFAAAGTTHKIKQSRLPSVGFGRLIERYKQASRKQQIMGGALAVALIFGGGSGIYALTKKEPKPPATPAPVVDKVEEPPKPTTEASKLTGEQISPELNKRQVTGVMIENSPDARPQAALKDAGVVYEAIAEGGITRFLAIFHHTQPDYIGPVRSVRPYYVELLRPYDASIVHAGGSAEGLAKVRDTGTKDIDHGANGSAFRRANDRYAPHNLYTSMADLDKVSANRGFTTSNSKSFARKADQPNQTVTARSIDLAISSALYNVHYDYDQASNSYKRVMAGKPHTDHRSGQQIAPKVVVALVANYSQRGIYSVYQTTGSNTAFIFQDGTVQQVTWTRAAETDQFTFTDAAGKPVALNAGQTWISLVKLATNVTYVP